MAGAADRASACLGGDSSPRSGAALRLWAAGHVEKSREVTRAGRIASPGIRCIWARRCSASALASRRQSRSWLGWPSCYLAATLTAAVRAEEAHLRDKFGDAYDAYRARRAPPSGGASAWPRAIAQSRAPRASPDCWPGCRLSRDADCMPKVWYSQWFAAVGDEMRHVGG